VDATTTWLGIATGLGMAAVGLAAGALAWRWAGRGPGGWTGAAAWSTAVALKVGAYLATAEGVETWLAAHAGWSSKALEAAYAGALTGVFEVGLVGLLAWRGRLGRADLGEAVRFGVAFGVAEAVSIGLAVGAAAGLAGLAPGLLPPGALKEVVRQLGGGTGGLGDVVWPVLERVSALVFHLVTTLMILAGRRARRPWLGFGVAFAYKSLVDAAAAWMVLTWGAKLSASQTAIAEGGFAVAAAASLLLLAPLGRTLPPRPGAGEPRWTSARA
jgi:hypothetical protein